ncbi:class I SAM-dependent methyltransferase [Lujinxingia sediminis]|uniref:Class I SAM-dependent methyltransferase n=2 Tax=Lujinxingia sediminis TaxID=2480984 RepID=A0ABY0CRP9_9DELT|nr:class I SAM-dependent methyltransferase [Lujinxingia sediminis]
MPGPAQRRPRQRVGLPPGYRIPGSTPFPDPPGRGGSALEGTLGDAAAAISRGDRALWRRPSAGICQAARRSLMSTISDEDTMAEQRPFEPGRFWDEMFDRPDYRYGESANPFVIEAVEARLEPGATVLCVGDGEGRNGVGLARAGYRVTSLEPSAVGLAKTRQLAAKYQVEVETIQGVMPSDVLGEREFDAVVLAYVHVPPAMRPELHRACVQHLAPGGRIVLEGFTPRQRELGRTSGGPGDVAMLFEPETLREDFEGLTIELLQEEQVELAAGDGHRGVAEVVRLIARRV